MWTIRRKEGEREMQKACPSAFKLVILYQSAVVFSIAQTFAS